MRYGKVDAPNGRDNVTWCREMGIELLPTIEEVVASSDFLDGRRATLHFIQDSPFILTLQFANGGSSRLEAAADFFAVSIADLIQFFHTGRATVDPAETIAVITLIEYGLKAMQTPFKWITLPGNSSE